MNRRTLLGALACGLLRGPLAAQAQEVRKARVGVLSAGANPRSASFYVAFEQRLRELGYIATNESEAHPDYKKRLVLASEVDTVHTELHHIGWPPHSPVRVLRSALTDGTEKPEDSIGRMRRGNEMVEIKPFSVVMPTIHAEGRTDLMANYAGQGVGRIQEILPAATVVERIAHEAESIMRTRLREISPTNRARSGHQPQDRSA